MSIAVAESLSQRFKSRALDDDGTRRRGGGGGGGGGAGGRSGRAAGPSRMSTEGRRGISSTARLKNALTTPQAVIRIPPQGGTGSGARMGAQVDYLSHDGKLPIEVHTKDGIATIEAGDDRAEIVKEWYSQGREGHGQLKDRTRHVIASFPKGTDPLTAQAMGRDFAEAVSDGRFGDQWDFLAVHHNDQGAPHTHIVFHRVGRDGTTLHLHPKHISVQDLREVQVEIAAEYGIELNATSRATRGIAPQPALAQRRAEAQGRHIARSGEKRTPFGNPVDHAQEAMKAKSQFSTTVQREATKIAALAEAFETVQNHTIAARVMQAAHHLQSGRPLTETDMAQPAQSYLADDVEEGNRLLRDFKGGVESIEAYRGTDDHQGITENTMNYERTVQQIAAAGVQNPYLANEIRQAEVRHPEIAQEIETDVRPAMSAVVATAAHDVVGAKDGVDIYETYSGKDLVEGERMLNTLSNRAELMMEYRDAAPGLDHDVSGPRQEALDTSYQEAVDRIAVAAKTNTYLADATKNVPDVQDAIEKIAERGNVVDLDAERGAQPPIDTREWRARDAEFDVKEGEGGERVAAGAAMAAAATAPEAGEAKRLVETTLERLITDIEHGEKIVGQIENAKERTDTDVDLVQMKQAAVQLGDAETDPRIKAWQDELDQSKGREIDPNGPDRAIIERAEAQREALQPRPEPQRTALEALDDADKKVEAMFNERGFKGELMVERIKAGQEVDQATRDKWHKDDINTYARTNNVSDKQARDAVRDARNDASAIYQDVRQEIRSIRDAEVTAGRSGLEDKTERAVDTPAATERSRPEPQDKPAAERPDALQQLRDADRATEPRDAPDSERDAGER